MQFCQCQHERGLHWNRYSVMAHQGKFWNNIKYIKWQTHIIMRPEHTSEVLALFHNILRYFYMKTSKSYTFTKECHLKQCLIYSFLKKSQANYQDIKNSNSFNSEIRKHWNQYKHQTTCTAAVSYVFPFHCVFLASPHYKVATWWQKHGSFATVKRLLTCVTVT